VAKTLETLLKLKGKVDPSLQRALKQANSKTVREAQKTSRKVQSTFAGMAKKAAAYIGAAFAVRSMVDFGKASIEAAQDEVLAQTKLAEVMRQRMGATEDQTQKILDLASAQQKLGVIGDEVQVAGGQQLATFLNQTSSLESLIPAMNNLAAQQKGVNATQEDMVNIANLMGKAMHGQTGALRRVGIVFSEAEEEVLKYGNETERAATLAQVVTNNVGNMNEEIAKTDFGKFTQAKNIISDMQETVGKQLMPIVGNIAQKFLPLIEKGFVWIGSLIEKLSPLLGKLADLIMPVLDTLGQLLAEVIEPLIEPLTEIAEAILPILSTFLGAIMDAVKPLLKAGMKIINRLLPPLLKLLEPLNDILRLVGEAVGWVAEMIGGVLTEALNAIMPVIEPLLDGLRGVIDFLVGVFTLDWERAWEGIKAIFEGIWNSLIGIVRGVINAIIGILNAMVEAYNVTIGEVGSWIGVNIKITPIGYLAEGATVTRPALAVIGEAGAETVVPHNNRPRSRMLLREAAAGVGMSLGGNTFVYQPSITLPPGADKKDFQQVLDDDFERFKKWMDRYSEEEGRLAFA
jgi:phage-related protein